MKKEKKADSLIRTMTGIVIFPILAVVLIFSNTLIMDIITAIVAFLCMYEYYHSFKSTGKANPAEFLGYIYCILIVFTHFVSDKILVEILVFSVPVAILILFAELVISNGKRNIKDVTVSLFGICYIPLMFVFLSLIRNLEFSNGLTGKILVWFVVIAAWGNDVFAYFIGKYFGKHKFTKISPNKTIEGAVAGILGAVFLGIIYAVLCNNLFNVAINYIAVILVVAVLSIIGQIGDLAASSIKRYCEIKDFSDALPGHGGFLDRFDSIIFVLPFAFILFHLL